MSDRLDPPVAQIQPTPERGWLYRRLFSFLSSAALLFLLWEVIKRMEGSAELKFVATLLAGLLALDRLLYLGGATLTDIWRLVSAVRTTRIINTTETRS